MAAVTAQMIKEFREMTGVGMSDCKKALVEADGDFDKAVEILRKNGLAQAAKKASRVASEGLVNSCVKGKVGVVCEINSETDFVAKNVEFRTFVDDVTAQALATSNTTVEELLTETWNKDNTKTVGEALTEKISVIGENLNIRRFVKYTAVENGHLVNYIHGNGRATVLLEIVSKSTNEEKIAEIGKNIAMQIAAMSPKFVKASDVPTEDVEKEKAILTEITLKEGKPANVAENIVKGRLAKSINSMCLYSQEYVKDGNFTVETYLKEIAKELGETLEISRFTRFETGEGIEKKEENFAEEVAKTIQG